MVPDITWLKELIFLYPNCFDDIGLKVPRNQKTLLTKKLELSSFTCKIPSELSFLLHCGSNHDTGSMLPQVDLPLMIQKFKHHWCTWKTKSQYLSLILQRAGYCLFLKRASKDRQSIDVQWTLGWRKEGWVAAGSTWCQSKASLFAPYW